MKATLENEIISWLNKMTSRFEWITFKYEYSNEMKAHLICVYPQGEVDKNDEYCLEEVDFGFCIDKVFPNEVLLFSTEEQLFSCSEDSSCASF